MFGHVAGRKRWSRWAILSFLFAVALAWSFAVKGELIALRVGLAVGFGICLLLTFVFTRRLRRSEGHTEVAMEAQAKPAAGEPATEKRPLTYEEVFQVHVNVEEESLADTPVHEDMQEEWKAEGDEVAEIEAEGQHPAEESAVEEAAPTSDEELQPIQSDLDGAVEHVEADEANQAEVESQDALQRMRDEFAARAKEAELRVKQREAELDEAGSAPKSTS